MSKLHLTVSHCNHSNVRVCVGVGACAATDAGVQMRQIEALGISTQRGTFTTWDR